MRQGRAAFNDPFFCGLKVYQGPKSIEDFQHNVGTVFCHNGVYESTEKFKKNGQTGITHEGGAGRPYKATADDNIERVRDMILLDDRLLMKWQIVCKLVMVRPMKSSTVDLAFIKSVQDGYQNNSQCCLNKRAWTFANKIWIAMIKKVTPSWTGSSLVTKHGSTVTSRSVNGRLWNGNIHNRPS